MAYDPEFLEDVDAVFAEYVQTDALLAAMTEEIYRSISSAITGKTRAQVLEMAREKAAKLVTRMTEEMKDKLREKLAYALENQLGPEGTARLLRNGLGLDAVREAQYEAYRDELEASGRKAEDVDRLLSRRYSQLLNERARTIANTEAATAFEEASLEQANERGSTHKFWITTADAKVSEICAGCQSEGLIPIDATFSSSGTDAPPGHPNCRCTLGYASKDERGIGMRLAERQSRSLVDRTEQAKLEAQDGQEK